MHIFCKPLKLYTFIHISWDEGFRYELLGYEGIAGGQMKGLAQLGGRRMLGSRRGVPSRQMTGGGPGGELESL